MIDYWKLTRDFKVGDTVQKYIPSRAGNLSPYVGRVTSVLPGIGFLDVQWPFGNERVSPEDVVRVNPSFMAYTPPTLDFSYYPGWDARQAARKAPWRTTEVPAGFHMELARVFHRGASEVRAYDELWHRFASYTDDGILRDEVQKFYVFAANAAKMFRNQQIRTGAYWAGAGRRHRATKKEFASKQLGCPRRGCEGLMRKSVYKVDEEGQRVRLLSCPECGYLLKTDHVMGPSGEPWSW